MLLRRGCTEQSKGDNVNSETLPACPAHGVRFVVPLDPEDREQHSAIDATHRSQAGFLVGGDVWVERAVGVQA